MAGWDDVYSGYDAVKSPSKYVVELVPLLIEKGVREVLDVGCGDGRHTLFLAEQGFKVHGIDGSQKAISTAKVRRNGHCIDYVCGNMTDLHFFHRDSMDFVLANHSLEYATWEDIGRSVSEITRVLRPGKSVFVRVASSERPFNTNSTEACGIPHKDFCIENSLQIHHFNREELKKLFEGYDIKRLKHVTRRDDSIPIPQSELILFGYKK
jgi:ubiquinone/menaquinone biosynthesis C-methylase UbiE